MQPNKIEWLEHIHHPNPKTRWYRSNEPEKKQRKHKGKLKETHKYQIKHTNWEKMTEKYYSSERQIKQICSMKDKFEENQSKKT